MPHPSETYLSKRFSMASVRIFVTHMQEELGHRPRMLAVSLVKLWQPSIRDSFIDPVTCVTATRSLRHILFPVLEACFVLGGTT